MKHTVSLFAIAAIALQLGVAPARAEMTDDEKVAAAIAILGIAALAHNKHHYANGYKPANDVELAEFERGYRDALHGYPYWEHSRTKGYAEGYLAGDRERGNSMAHRRHAPDQKAPPMANRGCAENVARNFAVDRHHVHITRAQSPAKHEWRIEAAVGHQFMVCTMRDTGELIDLRGGRM
jgi:hypothetical protein